MAPYSDITDTAEWDAFDDDVLHVGHEGRRDDEFAVTVIEENCACVALTTCTN